MFDGENKPHVDFLISKKAFETNLRTIKEKLELGAYHLERSDLGLELISALAARNSLILKDHSIPILGANLSILCSLIGTQYMPSFKDSILFIEECHEAQYKIERMLWQIHHTGLFEGVKELWIGTSKEADMPEALISKFSSIYGFRAISDLPIGHGELNFITKLF